MTLEMGGAPVPSCLIIATVGEVIRERTQWKSHCLPYGGLNPEGNVSRLDKGHIIGSDNIIELIVELI